VQLIASGSGFIKAVEVMAAELEAVVGFAMRQVEFNE
jgi:hypothetical protein